MIDAVKGLTKVQEKKCFNKTRFQGQTSVVVDFDLCHFCLVMGSLGRSMWVKVDCSFQRPIRELHFQPTIGELSDMLGNKGEARNRVVT